MYKVIQGQEINNLAELQNLITGTIFSQKTAFSLDDIIKYVKSNLVGSPYHNDKFTEQRCEETINRLYYLECITPTSAGKYKLSMSFPPYIK